MRRVFFGLQIPTEIKQRLLQVRAEVVGAQWQDIEQLHLTSLFLGSLEEERLAALREAAGDISLPGFELQVIGLGCFGRAQAPQHLWAGVVPETSVISLHSAIKSQAENLGIETERRAYRPHLTLARFKRHPGSVEHLLAQYRETTFGSFQVDEFVLYESKQGSGGSVYTVLERYPLVRPAM